MAPMPPVGALIAGCKSLEAALVHAMVCAVLEALFHHVQRCSRCRLGHCYVPSEFHPAGRIVTTLSACSSRAAGRWLTDGNSPGPLPPAQTGRPCQPSSTMQAPAGPSEHPPPSSWVPTHSHPTYLSPAVHHCLIPHRWVGACRRYPRQRPELSPIQEEAVVRCAVFWTPAGQDW